MRATALLAAILAAGLLGCGSTDADTPAACLSGPATYLQALRGAPDSVELRGETRISDCLTRNQSAADLGRIGVATVRSAVELNSVATASARKPGGRSIGARASLRAGYLVGALERGSERTDGIHATLIDRVRTAARNDFSTTRPAIRTAYAAGFQAGTGGG